MKYLFCHGRSAALLAACMIALLSGCASLSSLSDTVARSVAAATGPARPPAAASASGVPPGTPQPAAAPGSSVHSFAAVIKDANKIEGLFTLYQREEKVWIELRPEDFGKPFFLSPKIATGIGEARLFGGTM